MATKDNGEDMKKKVIIGAGIIAGTALAAYLLSSPKSRKKAALKVKGWMKDMQKEVATRAKAVQDLSQAKYNEIVDEVAPKYEALKDVSAVEIQEFADELKDHWNNISKAVTKAGKSKKKK